MLTLRIDLVVLYKVDEFRTVHCQFKEYQDDTVLPRAWPDCSLIYADLSSVIEAAKLF